MGAQYAVTITMTSVPRPPPPPRDPHVLPLRLTHLCPTVSPWSREKDRESASVTAGRRKHSPFLSQPPQKKTLPPQPSDFPASHKAILLNISKKYSLTPSLFIYKNQLNTLLLCSIWKLEQPGLYLAEILLLSPQIPAQPDELEGLRKEEGDRGRRGKSHGRDSAVPRGPRSPPSPKDPEG